MSDQDSPYEAAGEALELVGAAFELATVGFPIVSIISAALRRLDKRGVRPDAELLRSMAEAVSAIGSRIDVSYAGDPDFEQATEEILERGDRAREVEKREYYARLWANLVGTQEARPDQSGVARLIDTLAALRPSHLWLLHELLRSYDWPVESPGGMAGFRKLFLQTHEGLDDELFYLDWSDLERWGLVVPMPSGATSLESARNFREKVTVVGVRFHQFVVLPYSDVHPV